MIPEDGNINQGAPFMVGGSQTNTTSNALNNSQPMNNKKPKKSGNLMLIGVICLTVAAICGIAFGVWAMMDGNAKKDLLSKENSSLQQKNNEYAAKVTELEKTNSELQEQLASYQTQPTQPDNPSGQSSASNETGYTVISIGDCVFDGGQGKTNILKCEAETSLGKGKFVWDSERNTLFFATPPEGN